MSPKDQSAKTDAQAYISRKMQECNSSQSQQDCLHKAAGDFLNKFPLKTIAEVFRVNETKPEYFLHCHQEAHYLGQEAYKRKKDIRKVFSESSYACLGGLFHGAVEGYFIEKNIQVGSGNDQQIAAQVPKICGKKEEYERTQDFTECNHGMGHALMFLTDDDLIRALKLCDTLPNGNQQSLCYTGAFMQNADGTANSEHPSKYLKEGDPLYTCTLLEEKYLNQCYTYAALTKTQADVVASANVCRQVPEKYQKDCFNTVGRDRTMFSANPQELKSECLKIPEPPFSAECFNGAAYNLVVRFNYTSSIPQNFCKALEQTQKAACYYQIGKAAYNITSDKKVQSQFCSKIDEKQYEKDCFNQG